MPLERTALFVDVSNIYYCVGKKYSRKVDYRRYLDTATDGQPVYRAYAYCAQIGTEANYFFNCLRDFGYELRSKKPKQFENPDFNIDFEAVEQLIDLVGHNIDELLLKKVTTAIDSAKKALRSKRDIRKANWDVGIAMDVVRIINRVDKIIIGSADGDFAPLAEWIREQGCKCTVYACNISRELREAATETIEIDETVLENRIDTPVDKG